MRHGEEYGDSIIMKDPEMIDDAGDDTYDDEELQGTITRLMEQAYDWYVEELEPVQTKATDYYKGEPFGDEEDGRSKVVSTDVRDATLAQMPSLMRIFFGPENAVEYEPTSGEDIPIAEQRTDYINYIIRNDNQGFLEFYSAFKDALVRKLGIFKWWAEDDYRVTESEHSDMSEVQLAMIDNDEDAEILQATPQGTDPMTGEQLYKVRVKHTRKDVRLRFAAIPPNEFLFTPATRKLNQTPVVAHSRELTVSDLIEMGFDYDDVIEHAGQVRSGSTDDLQSARRFDKLSYDDQQMNEDEGDESQRKVLYTEAYARIDTDGDHIAELRLFKCVGPTYKILNGRGEVVDSLPFSTGTPDIEGHTLVGDGNYDYLRDVQRVKSEALRGMLNSLSQAVEPTLEVVNNQVNMADLLNPEISGVLRVKQPGMVREIKHTFVGGDVMPVLAYYDEIRENRTGTSKAAAGLDADSLQSATKAAVAATLSGSQQRIEMIARTFAETLVRDLFKGLSRLAVKHQNRARVVRLRNKFVEVDPRHWNDDMDVVVNVGIGSGSQEEKLAALGAIAEKQEMLMQVSSPLVSMVEYRNTLARFCELVGYKNADEFFKPWGNEEEMQAQQAAAQQPQQPDPAMLVIEVERMKNEQQAMLAQAKMELEKLKLQMEDDRERDRMARETALKELELELKHMQNVNDAQVRDAIERDRMAQDADLRAREMAARRAAVQGGSA